MIYSVLERVGYAALGIFLMTAALALQPDYRCLMFSTSHHVFLYNEHACVPYNAIVPAKER